MKNYSKREALTLAASVLGSLFLTATLVSAATTISTNVQTDGTLSVTGLSPLTTVTTSGSVGIASTTPGTNLLLAVGGQAIFAGTTTVGQLVSTSTITVQGIATSTFSGGVSTAGLSSSGGISLSGGTINQSNTATNTLSSISAAGLAASNGVTITGGTILDTSTATSTFSGALQFPYATTSGISVGGGATLIRHLSASASLDFPSIPFGTCSDLTLTVTGAADGDAVALGIPNALATASTTLQLTGFVSSANTVKVRACLMSNGGGAAVDPAAAVVRASVWQY